ncbi:MAG: hypothetical protein P1P87_12385, partial [Trueperaceae bacterium]|nr:hypothetical protein [Trueperaceae bacterium]
SMFPSTLRSQLSVPFATADGERTIALIAAAARTHAALSVPSVLVPQERNLLLDPTHPRFAEVRIAAPQPFRFDDRL